MNSIIFEGIASGKIYSLSESLDQVKILFQQARQDRIQIKSVKLKDLATKLDEIQPERVSGK